MAIINKGTAFSNGEQLSASKLNSLVDGATFGTDSVDNASTIVNANGAITVRDSGVTAAKLATGAVTDAKLAAGAVTTAKILDDNVTTAKIADDNVTTAKIADDNVTFAKLTDVIDDDTMVTATDTTLATSESIKAYVDEYAFTYSGSTGTFSTTAGTFVDLDLSSIVGSNRALVTLEVYNSSVATNIFFRTKGSTLVPYTGGNNSGWGAAAVALGTSDNGGTVVVMTDQNGIIQHRTDNTSTGVKYTIQASQKLR